MSDSNVMLWHAIECPHCMRARLALAEKGIDYESHVVDLDDVGDEVRARNPQGQVPVLEHDGCVIYEAAVIAEYLDEAFEGPRLRPVDASGRARVRLLIRWLDDQLVPAVYRLEMHRAGGGEIGEPVSDDALAEARAQILAVLETIATQMGDRDFVLGEFGIVDLFAAPFVTSLDWLGVRRDEIPKDAAAWIDRLRDRPSIAAEVDRRQDALDLRATG